MRTTSATTARSGAPTERSSGRPATEHGEGIALIASLSYSTYQAKLEGMFAKAFQLKGLEPVVVTLPDAHVTRRFLGLFGIDRFVTLEDYLTPELENEARRKAAELHASVASRPT